MALVGKRIKKSLKSSKVYGISSTGKFVAVRHCTEEIEVDNFVVEFNVPP